MNLPAVIKIILNIIFYIIYVLIFSLLFGLVLGFILKYLNKTLIWEPTATYIQVWLTIFVLFVTILFRKYFYISLNKEEK